MRHTSMRHAASIVLAVMLFAASGCDKKISQQDRDAINAAAIAAKATAASFKLIAPSIAAADPKEAAAVKSYLESHQVALSARAVALDSLAQAFSARNKVADATCFAIRDEAATAKRQSDNFKAITKSLGPTTPDKAADVTAFLAAHGAELQTYSDLIQKVATSLNPAPTVAPAPPK